jgi:hypothetical protein
MDMKKIVTSRENRREKEWNNVARERRRDDKVKLDEVVERIETTAVVAAVELGSCLASKVV